MTTAKTTRKTTQPEVLIVNSVRRALSKLTDKVEIYSQVQYGNPQTVLEAKMMVMVDNKRTPGYLVITATNTKRGLVTQFQITDEEYVLLAAYNDATPGRIPGSETPKLARQALLTELNTMVNSAELADDPNRSRLVRITNCLRKAWGAVPAKKTAKQDTASIQEAADRFGKVAEYVHEITGRDKLKLIACRAPEGTDYMYRAEPTVTMGKGSVAKMLENMTSIIGKTPKHEVTEYGEAYVFKLNRKRQVRLSVNVTGSRQNVRGITVRQYA